MSSLRALLLRHRAIALAILAAALCLKALVPAGYMLDSGSRSIAVRICDDGLGHAATRQIVVPTKATGSGEHPGDPAGKQASPECPYTALSLASLGAVDVVLLALALAFILALGFGVARELPGRREAYLRPPLRAPPAGITA